MYHFQELLKSWTKSKKIIVSRIHRLLNDRSKQLKNRHAPIVAPYFPGVILETAEFPEIFLLEETESYYEESDDELNPTWSDSDCSDMDMDIASDMETEGDTVEPRPFGRPKKVLTKEDLEKDQQTLKLVS